MTPIFRLNSQTTELQSKTIVLVFLFILTVCSNSAYADSPLRLDLRIADFEFSTEVAHTPDSRRQGLMYREQLGGDEGMLFVFPQPDYHSIWMVHTYIPLSVAFLDERGIILNIADMTPLTTTMHAPVTPAKFALEMNRGWFKKRDIKAGDRVLGLQHTPAGS